MAAKGLTAVAISITSLDPRIAMTLEPRAPSPERRLTAVRRLADAGVPTYVKMAPIIPAITDHEIEHLVERAAEAGAIGSVTSRCACRTRSRRCSAPGSTSIIPIAPAR